MGTATPTHRPDPGSIQHVAPIGRAQRVVATLGGRFSVELGIDLEGGADEIERWALAATLVGDRSPTSAVRTYRVFERAGVRTLCDAGAREWSELVSLVDAGGSARDDERTASRLLALADAVETRFGGCLAPVGERVRQPEKLVRELAVLPGWGPVTIGAFLRELRGIWPGAALPVDDRIAAAAEHLHVASATEDLRLLALVAHVDLRDLEVALVRLGLTHELARCPGGEECPFVGAERDRHFHG